MADPSDYKKGMNNYGLPNGACAPAEIMEAREAWRANNIGPLLNTDEAVLSDVQMYAEPPKVCVFLRFAQFQSEAAAGGAVDYHVTLGGQISNTPLPLAAGHANRVQLFRYGAGPQPGQGFSSIDLLGTAALNAYAAAGTPNGVITRRDSNILFTGGFAEYLCNKECCFDFEGVSAKYLAPFSFGPTGGLADESGLRLQRPDLLPLLADIERLGAEILRLYISPDTSRRGITAQSTGQLDWPLWKLDEVLAMRGGAKFQGFDAGQLAPDARALCRSIRVCRVCDTDQRLTFELEVRGENPSTAGAAGAGVLGVLRKPLAGGMPLNTVPDIFELPVEFSILGQFGGRCFPGGQLQASGK